MRHHNTVIIIQEYGHEVGHEHIRGFWNLGYDCAGAHIGFWSYIRDAKFWCTVYMSMSGLLVPSVQ
jgi:hypothetical protein